MALPEQEQSIKRREEVVISRFVAERFLEILEQKQKGMSLHILEFNQKSTSKDEDGTEHTVLKPVVLEEVDGFIDSHRIFLLKDRHGILNYLIEFEEHFGDGGVSHFIGITQVPSIESYENLGKWRDEVLSTRAKPARYRRPSDEENYRPRLAIQSFAPDRFTVELFEEDFNLEDLYEVLTGKPPETLTT